MTGARADAAIGFAREACADPAGAVSRWKALGGGKALGCVPLLTPSEIAAAAGMLPVSVGHGANAVGARSGAASCPLSGRALIEGAAGPLARVLDALAAPFVCPAASDFRGGRTGTAGGMPVFFAGGSDPPAGNLEDVLDRCERFAWWVGKVAGRPVRDGALEKAIRLEDGRRRLLASLEERMADAPGIYSAAEYGALVRAGSFLPAAAHAEVLSAALGRRETGLAKPRVRVFLSGLIAPDGVFDALDAVGAAVVGSDLGVGHRGLRDRADESGDALLALARRRMGQGGTANRECVLRSLARQAASRAAECGADRLVVVAGRRCCAATAAAAGPGGGGEGGEIPVLVVDPVDYARGRGAAARRIARFLERGGVNGCPESGGGGPDGSD